MGLGKIDMCNMPYLLKPTQDGNITLDSVSVIVVCLLIVTSNRMTTIIVSRW